MTKLIRKTQQPSDYPSNQIHDAYSTSTTDTYSCNYINEARLEEYSTTEKIIGKWINGKPLYRKVITFKALPENTIKTVDCDIDNCDNIWIENQFAIANSKYVCILPMPGYDSNVGTSVTYSWLMNTTLNIYSNAGWGNDWTFYIILNYTKTTD